MLSFNITNPGMYIAGLLTSQEANYVTDLVNLTYADGDILYYNGTEMTNLAATTDGYVLTLDGGVPIWAVGGGGGGGTWGSITGTLSDQTDLQSALDAKANDSVVVKTTGAQTIAGIKTFSSFPVTPSSAPSSDYQTANKKYVDDSIAGAGGYTDEAAQDAIGGILVDSSEIDFTYNDATPSITAVLKAGSIDESKLDTSVNASLDLADSAVQPAAIANFETTTTLNARDTNNRDRANHTGSQAQSTITNLVTDLGNKQPLDAELTAIAGLTSAADRLPYFTGLGTASLATFTAAARTVLDDTTVAAMVTTLGGASSTGSGGLVRTTSPTLVTPNLGTPSTLVGTNISGTAASLTAGVANGLKSATTTVSVSAATAPTVGQVLTATSSTLATWQTPSGGGSGDVVGPASSTAMAVARYNGTTGKLLKNSLVTIDDVGNMSVGGTLGVDQINASGGDTVFGLAGMVNNDYINFSDPSGVVTLTAAGSSTNIGFNFIPKGTGIVAIGGSEIITLGRSSISGATWLSSSVGTATDKAISPNAVKTYIESTAVTMANKRLTKRVGTTTSSATPTINTDNFDAYHLTAQAADITSFTTNLTGTPTDFQQLRISVTGTAARAITWGASFENGPVALPTTTVTTTRLDVLLEYSTVTSKWRCMASGSTV